MYVALQPSGNPASRKHYQDTIQRPVPQEALRRHLSTPEFARLVTLVGNGPVATWGVTPGVSNVNQKKWERLGPGDCVLFAGAGRIKSSAIVVMKAHNRALAHELWGEDEDGQTWEYLYFLIDVTGHNIPITELGAVAGYQPGFTRVQGFNVLDREKSEQIRAAFELDSSVPLETTPEAAPSEAPPTVEGELDRTGTTTYRVEQGILKRTLMGGRPAGECGLCGRLVPAPLLIGAHIKKRSRCSDAERRDLANVAMLMCSLGCDDLYERGYLGVEDGVLRVSPLLLRTPPIEALAQIVDGRRVPLYGPPNAAYFAWHRDNVYKAAPQVP